MCTLTSRQLEFYDQEAKRMALQGHERIGKNIIVCHKPAVSIRAMRQFTKLHSISEGVSHPQSTDGTRTCHQSLLPNHGKVSC